MSDGPSKALPEAEPLDDIILSDDDATVADAAPPVQTRPSAPPPLARPPSYAPPPHVAPVHASASQPPPVIHGGSQPPAFQGGFQPPAFQGGSQPPMGGPQPPLGGFQPPMTGSQPPGFQGGSQPPMTSGSQPPGGAPSSGPLKAAKRAKLTLRIPDDEIARPLPLTPVGGFQAAPAAFSPDETIELPPGAAAAQIAAVDLGVAPGVDPTNERGWTPYQPEVSDEIDDQATTGHHPAALPPNGQISPASEEIPVEMDLSEVPSTQSDEVATNPRLPHPSTDSEEIKIEDGGIVDRLAQTTAETGEVEIAADDLLSVESLPVPALKQAGKFPAFKIEDGAAPTATSLIAGAPIQTVTPVMGVPAAQQPLVAARRQPIVQPSIGQLAPPPMTDSAASRKKTRPWWEELFNDDFIRTMAKVTDTQIGNEVTFIEESLGCEAGAMILDLACGTGRHAVELAARGYQVVGFDLSLAMLARASDEAQDRKQKINFVQGDMREMTFEETFDGVYSWNTSFGYFDEEKNGAVIARVHKSLKKGGQFLLDVVNRDFIVRQAPSLAWFEGDGCICMDEMTIDFITSRMKVKRTLMMDDGRTKEIEYSVRVYGLHELGKMLHDNGFRVAEVSGRTGTPGVFFGCESPRTLILAEKR